MEKGDQARWLGIVRAKEAPPRAAGVASGSNAPAWSWGDALNEREAEPGAIGAGGEEGVAEAVDVLRPEAGARVADPELDAGGRGRCAETRTAPPWGCDVAGVGDEVAEGLADLDAVRDEDGSVDR